MPCAASTYELVVLDLVLNNYRILGRL